MPELPEVETVCRGLEPVMVGAWFDHVDVRRADLRFPFPPNFATRLTGSRVQSLTRRSKYIWCHLDTDETLIIHLGMSGRVTIDTDLTHEIGTHDHVSFHLHKENWQGHIHYTDPRRFGLMDLCPTAALDQHKLFKNIGPEPLGNHWTASDLYAATVKRRSPIKTVLLDQKVVCGLGNIYVCEALFRAGIHPETLSNTLTEEACSILVPHIKDVLIEAIDSGGSTLRDYVRSDGGLGYFQHQFAVYGREGEPCMTHGCNQTITRIVQSNRSTFFCPVCQPQFRSTEKSTA